MSSIVQTVYSCIQKKPASEQVEVITDPDDVKENDAPEAGGDKKTDEQTVEAPPAGFVWRLSSGVYNTATGAVGGAVGLGVNAVKWTAGTGYNMGSAVVSRVPVPPIPFMKKKDKKE